MQVPCIQDGTPYLPGSLCYLRMGQGLTGGPGTYTRLKDIVTGPIPKLHAEPALNWVSSNTAFDFFVENDIGGAVSIRSLINFLHNHYFPRLAWSRLTPNPVPQGSPLSPILFLFYNANLVEICNPPTLPASGTGFVDDVNTLAFGKST
jgi:hypothetical protein